jgi:hypothetical protein
MRGLQAAAADLANGHSRHTVGKAGADERLPGGILAHARGQHLAHDHFGNLIRPDTGPSQQGLDDLRTQIRRRHLGYGTVEFSDGGAQRRGDHYIVHGLISYFCSTYSPGASAIGG